MSIVHSEARETTNLPGPRNFPALHRRAHPRPRFSKAPLFCRALSGALFLFSDFTARILRTMFLTAVRFLLVCVFTDAGNIWSFQSRRRFRWTTMEVLNDRSRRNNGKRLWKNEKVQYIFDATNFKLISIGYHPTPSNATEKNPRVHYKNPPPGI